jgi:hypothetical protein
LVEAKRMSDEDLADKQNNDHLCTTVQNIFRKNQSIKFTRDDS